MYAIVIVFYNEELKNGEHFVFVRNRIPKEKNIYNRLYLESLYILQLAEILN